MFIVSKHFLKKINENCHKQKFVNYQNSYHKMVNFVVLNWIEKFNGSWFIHFKHNDRQIISINVNYIIWRSISRCIQDAFTIHIYINEIANCNKGT